MSLASKPEDPTASRQLVRPTIEIGSDGTVRAWNDAATALYGYTAQEALGAQFSSICFVGPKGGKDDSFDRGLRGAAIEHSEALHRAKDGRFFKVVFSMRSSESKDGESPTVGLVIQDSAEDEEISTDEGKLWTWAAVETAVEGIITLDQKGIIEYTNESACRMFGYPAKELIGMKINMLMPAPYRDEHDEYINRYLATGEKKIIGIGREALGKRKDGSVFPIHLAVSEVQIGKHRVFTGFIYDITERKTAEEEKDRLLREINKRSREINCLYRIGETMRPSEPGAAAFTATADIIHDSLAHPAMTGTRLTIDDKVYENDSFKETAWVLSCDIVASGQVHGKVDVFFLKDEVESHEDPEHEDERNVIEAVARVLSEAIERSEAEAKVIQASKMASIGELAAGVGHEINNPVNGIINCADIIMKEADEGSTTHKFAELIRSEADRIAVIVHNLLAFSRQDKEQHSAGHIKDIIEAVLSLCNKKLEKSHIRLEVAIPDNLPRIYCRSEQLQQVFMNLILNSMDALDEKYPGVDAKKILRISASELSAEDRAFLRVTVEDQGLGISEANLQRIFDPFFTTKGRDKGTGLGLSISDGIVKGHGGTIECETELGEFTRFHVDLPIRHKGSTVTERSSEALLQERTAEPPSHE
ncbi:MAG: PAS domain S-box protein [Candidatus Hydrogenedentes bacterium]|nr:PAS domain S-box protein [Candidatus Hydrogenedentota bacterium]